MSTSDERVGAASPPSNSAVCARCGAPGKSRCGRCKQEPYCSRYSSCCILLPIACVGGRQTKWRVTPPPLCPLYLIPFTLVRVCFQTVPAKVSPGAHTNIRVLPSLIWAKQQSPRTNTNSCWRTRSAKSWPRPCVQICRHFWNAQTARRMLS